MNVRTTGQAALEHSELERQRLQQELDEANHVIEATATRTLQRAFGQRWAAVLKADPEALKEERRRFTQIQMEQESQALRVTLSEKRKELIRQEKALRTEVFEQQAAKHSSVVAIAAELHTLEAEVVEMARRQSSVLATKRREALKMSLQLRGAAAKEKRLVATLAERAEALGRSEAEVQNLKGRLQARDSAADLSVRC